MAKTLASSVDILDSTSRLEQQMAWILFKQDVAHIWEQSPSTYTPNRWDTKFEPDTDWVPGDKLWNHIGNTPRNVIEIFHDVTDVEEFTFARCKPCGIGWVGDEPCWMCGKVVPDPLRRPRPEAIRPIYGPGQQVSRAPDWGELFDRMMDGREHHVNFYRAPRVPDPVVLDGGERDVRFTRPVQYTLEMNNDIVSNVTRFTLRRPGMEPRTVSVENSFLHQINNERLQEFVMRQLMRDEDTPNIPARPVLRGSRPLMTFIDEAASYDASEMAPRLTDGISTVSRQIDRFADRLDNFNRQMQAYSAADVNFTRELYRDAAIEALIENNEQEPLTPRERALRHRENQAAHRANLNRPVTEQRRTRVKV